jgi:hypothetical protein
MWLNISTENVDILGAECIAYHFALMMTTDLKFIVNTSYSATDVFAMIANSHEPKNKSTRLSQVLSLDSQSNS